MCNNNFLGGCGCSWIIILIIILLCCCGWQRLRLWQQQWLRLWLRQQLRLRLLIPARKGAAFRSPFSSLPT